LNLLKKEYFFKCQINDLSL